jgi:galactokinase
VLAVEIAWKIHCVRTAKRGVPHRCKNAECRKSVQNIFEFSEQFADDLQKYAIETVVVGAARALSAGYNGCATLVGAEKTEQCGKCVEGVGAIFKTEAQFSS